MRVAFLSKSLEFSLNLLRVISPIGNDLSIIVIADDKQFVSIVNLVSELECRSFQLVDIRANRQRIVDKHHDARRGTIGRETLYRLLDAVIE